MKAEVKIALFLLALSTAIGYFRTLPMAMSEFLVGMFFVLGLFLIGANLLPKDKYDNLLYRKWLAGR